MKKIIALLLLTICLTATFASESKPLPMKAKTFTMFKMWTPGELMPDAPPISFYTGGYIITVYCPFTEGQIWETLDFVERYNYDWYTIYMYLYAQYDSYFDITVPHA